MSSCTSVEEETYISSGLRYKEGVNADNVANPNFYFEYKEFTVGDDIIPANYFYQGDYYAECRLVPLRNTQHYKCWYFIVGDSVTHKTFFKE